MQPVVSMIWAMDRNGVIGADQDLPWRLPEDTRFFMMMTARKPVIMGRKTLESMAAPLPRRLNIVVTRDTGYQAPSGVAVCHTFEAALAVAREHCAAMHLSEIMVAGGSEIYALALPVAQRLYVTTVDAEVTGETRFPEMDWQPWQRCWQRCFENLPGHDYSFDIAQWERAP